MFGWIIELLSCNYIFMLYMLIMQLSTECLKGAVVDIICNMNERYKVCFLHSPNKHTLTMYNTRRNISYVFVFKFLLTTEIFCDPVELLGVERYKKKNLHNNVVQTLRLFFRIW